MQFSFFYSGLWRELLVSLFHMPNSHDDIQHLEILGTNGTVKDEFSEKNPNFEQKKTTQSVQMVWLQPLRSEASASVVKVESCQWRRD